MDALPPSKVQLLEAAARLVFLESILRISDVVLYYALHPYIADA